MNCISKDRPAPWGSGKPCRHPVGHGGSCAAVKDGSDKIEHRWWMTDAERITEIALTIRPRPTKVPTMNTATDRIMLVVDGTDILVPLIFHGIDSATGNAIVSLPNATCATVINPGDLLVAW